MLAPDLKMPWEDPMDKEREARRNDARGGANEDATRPPFDAIVSQTATGGEFGMPGNELWGKPLDATAAETDALREVSRFLFSKNTHRSARMISDRVEAQKQRENDVTWEVSEQAPVCGIHRLEK